MVVQDGSTVLSKSFIKLALSLSDVLAFTIGRSGATQQFVAVDLLIFYISKYEMVDFETDDFSCV